MFQIRPLGRQTIKLSSRPLLRISTEAVLYIQSPKILRWCRACTIVSTTAIGGHFQQTTE